MSGIYNLTGYKLTITEIPIGFDREKYVILLDKLEEQDKIVAYEDRCDKNGVNFVVKLRRTLKWDDKKIIALFKMEKTITENITTLDENSKLKIFESPEDLVIYFVKYKMGILTKRINFMKSKVTHEIELNNVRVKWIKSNLNGEVDYKNLSKKSLEKLIGDKYGNKFIENLIPMNLYQLTTDEIEKLEIKLQDSELKLKYWNSQNQLSQYITDIKSI
jgi:DNA topoisomerase-2